MKNHLHKKMLLILFLKIQTFQMFLSRKKLLTFLLLH